MIVFLNGQFVSEEQATISVLDRGFLYGDGLFETLRIYKGKPFCWRQHWERLGSGANFLRIKIPYSSEETLQFTIDLMAKNQMDNAILRINLSRGVGPRGYSIKGADKPNFVLTLHPIPKSDSEKPPSWQLITSSYRLPANDPLAPIKSSSKLLHIMARAEAMDKGADDALLLDTSGNVAETSCANLFWIHKGTLFTPPVSCGILPGITRQVVMELCRKLKIECEEKAAPQDALVKSEGAFLTLSTTEVVEVTTLDNRELARSPLPNNILQAYQQMVSES